MRHRVAILATLVVAAGCAGHQAGPATADTGGGGVQAQQRRAPRADQHTITAEEIAQNGGNFSNLYDYVSSRHSDWFTSANSMATLRNYPIQVFVDGQRFGTDPSYMRQIPLRGIALARRISASEAESKYGTDNNAGAIEVWTRLELVR